MSRDEMRFLRRELIQLWIRRKLSLDKQGTKLTVNIRKQTRNTERYEYGQELKAYA